MDHLERNYRIGSVTIDDSFHTQHADEAYFHYFGNDVLYSILRTIHEADQPLFCGTIEAMQVGEKTKLILRMKGCSGAYCWMLASITATVSTEENRLFRISLQDIYQLETMMQGAEQEISEYRYILNLMKDFAFTYHFETKRIQIFFFDSYRNVVLVNEALQAWKQRAIAGHFVERSEIAEFERLCADIETGTYRFQHECTNSILTDGKRMECCLFKGITRYDDLEHRHVVGTISVIHTKYKTKDVNWTLETNRDSLTDLLNKQAIVNYAKNGLQSNPTETMTLVLIDIDDFKEINDRFGHLLGDEVLYTISHILKAEIGGRGIAGRIGDGLFQLVLEGIRDETDLRGILRAIRTKIEWAFVDRAEKLTVTCSIGAASYPLDAKEYDTVFMQADKALFIARAKGKNRYVIYDIAKHGAVEPNRERSTADLYIHTPDRSKPDVVGSIAASLLFQQTPELPALLAEIGEQFWLDGIHIYAGDGMQPLLQWGATVETPADFLFADQFLELFNEDGVYVIDNANSLEGRAETAFRHFTDCNVLGAVLYVIWTDGRPAALLSFDLVNRFRKWSEMDVNYLTILAKILEALLRQSGQI